MLLHDAARAVVQVDPGGERRLEGAHELERALVVALVVEADRGDVVREQVAQQPLEERGLAVEEHRGALAGGEGAHLVPRAREVPPVPQEGLGLAREPRGAGDQPPSAALLSELLEDRLEASPLVLVGDLARDPDVLHRGHEDDVAAGQRDVRGDPRPLGAHGLLEDLDHHLLTLVELVLDRGAAQSARLLGGEEVLGELLEDVGGVEERVALEPEVHEGGLHAGEHPGHAPLVDAAHDAAVRLALEEELGDDAVLEEGDPGLAGVGADDEVSGHSVSGAASFRPAREECEAPGQRQFAKRRMRTLSTSPTPMSEESTEEPP